MKDGAQSSTLCAKQPAGSLDISKVSCPALPGPLEGPSQTSAGASPSFLLRGIPMRSDHLFGVDFTKKHTTHF